MRARVDPPHFQTETLPTALTVSHCGEFSERIGIYSRGLAIRCGGSASGVSDGGLRVPRRPTERLLSSLTKPVEHGLSDQSDALLSAPEALSVEFRVLTHHHVIRNRDAGVDHRFRQTGTPADLRIG